MEGRLGAEAEEAWKQTQKNPQETINRLYYMIIVADTYLSQLENPQVLILRWKNG